MESSRIEHLLIFGVFAAAAWFIVIYFLPRMLMNVYKRGILVKGFGEGPIPINTLYTQSQASFADPIHESSSRLMTTGGNRDALIMIGWLDLRNEPQVLHVPDMAGRYYSIQFTNPAKNTNFAYVGKRTTGTAAGTYLICGPGWKGTVPQDMAPITSPNNAVLIVGRVLVENMEDLPTAYEMAKQIRLSPMA